MEDIKGLLDDRLWGFINKNYASENYSSAVLDSIQFIGDLLREKSGLESDGNTLVGESLGGKKPKIKLNKLQTETEKNIQKGVEFILRGIYSAFRNPRSHTKHLDKKEDADAIIIFINHLLKLLDKSKGKFSVDLLVNRISDEDFVKNQRYVDLIISSIPSKKYSNTAFELFQNRNIINEENFKIIFPELLDKLMDEERNEVIKDASEELRYANSGSEVGYIVELFKNHWSLIDEDAKMRSENKLIKCLKKGSYYFEDKINQSGESANSLLYVIDSLTLLDEFLDTIYEKIASNDKNEQRYIIDYYGFLFEEYYDSFSWNIVSVINNKLSEGDEIVYNYAKYKLSKKEIIDGISDALRNYEATKNYE